MTNSYNLNIDMETYIAPYLRDTTASIQSLNFDLLVLYSCICQQSNDIWFHAETILYRYIHKINFAFAT